jgi:hypothetical protein
MKYSAWYAIVVGFLIIAQWVFFITAGSVAELQTAPWSIGFHIAAEMLLALTLIVSGIVILQSKPLGYKVLLVALGMVIYSEINSPVILHNRDNGHW